MTILSEDDNVACGCSLTPEHPGSTGEGGGANPTQPLQFEVKIIPVAVAREFVTSWHSRLPVVPSGTQFAFGAYYNGQLEAAALWSNCSARNLPQDWRELRRMAVSSLTAPKNTASKMLAFMCRWLKKNHPEISTLISYQDLGVHKGTIYRAAGWTPVAISRPRLRSRTVEDQPWTKERIVDGKKLKTRKMYRSNSRNLTPEGTDAAISSAKVRWQYSLSGEKFTALTPAQIEVARNMKQTK